MTPQQPIDSDFLRIAQRLHRAQLAATTPTERDKANALMADFFMAAAQGRLDYWIATHRDEEP